MRGYISIISIMTKYNKICEKTMESVFLGLERDQRRSREPGGLIDEVIAIYAF
jgi:hypothetical protein